MRFSKPKLASIVTVTTLLGYGLYRLRASGDGN
jgi:hypothetical protein